MTPEALARLHRAAFTTQRPWSEAEFRDLLASPHVFLVETDHAFALGRVIAGEAELLTLATDPAYQRQGQGRMVLQLYHDEALRRRAETFFLEVAENNLPAIALYRANGYAKTAERPNYYRQTDGSRVAAWIMTRGHP
ncbi:GNAT family N-acetyltransferase [Thalassovita aquimarina]|uniref:GNAT family N-acetyltransferase n=1 Tax=Thalassovita aquimarina TaxID=2785917 RepID=A0ABS5HPI2_9RHOB|nr:GNAT family N-acetyltransferase [Thalassovita aquimarina]MBR9650874.1 GNAT family N-acetyltransferase [Thalassovita aquimarina]